MKRMLGFLSLFILPIISMNVVSCYKSSDLNSISNLENWFYSMHNPQYIKIESAKLNIPYGDRKYNYFGDIDFDSIDYKRYIIFTNNNIKSRTIYTDEIIYIKSRNTFYDNSCINDTKYGFIAFCYLEDFFDQTASNPIKIAKIISHVNAKDFTKTNYDLELINKDNTITNYKCIWDNKIQNFYRSN